VLLSALMMASHASANEAFAQEGASSVLPNTVNVRVAKVPTYAKSPHIRRVVQPVPKTISVKGGSFVVKCKGMSVDGFKSPPLYRSNMPIMSGEQKAVKIRQFNRHKACQSQRLSQS